MNMNSVALKKVVIESVIPNFYECKISDLTIIIDENGYMNASKLCQSVGKDFNAWRNRECIQNLLDCLTPHVIGKNVHLTDNLIYEREEPELVSGSYIHPDLAVHVATWCSDMYSVKVSMIMKKYHIKQYSIAKTFAALR